MMCFINNVILLTYELSHIFLSSCFLFTDALNPFDSYGMETGFYMLFDAYIQEMLPQTYIYIYKSILKISKSSLGVLHI